MKPTKYKSKVSYGLLIFIFLLFSGFLITNVIQGIWNAKMIVIPVVLFAFIIHLFFGTEYTIDNNILKIKFGFFKHTPIEINDIKEVSKTNTILSSPAASFDRIRIKYGRSKAIVISPKDKKNFITELININPKIKNNLTE